MNFFYLIFLIVMLPADAFGQSAMEEKTIRLCDTVTIKSLEPIDFTEAELNIICGDADSPGWKSIPVVQAKFFLKKALEQRGYWASEVVVSDQSIHVDAGQIKTVKNLTVVKSPFDLHVSRYWYPIGKPLTSKILDEIENWIKHSLGEGGYPCPKIQTVASFTSGEIEISVDAGDQWVVGDVRSAGIPGKKGNVERRYDAFSMGQVYDATKFSLTSQRLIVSDMVISSAFVPRCEEEKGLNKIEHVLAVAPPRSISFGFGFDTEEYAIARAEWKNGRMLDSASPLRTVAQISYLKQRANINWDWYYLPFASRHFMSLYAGVSRVNEKRFEEISGRAAVFPVWDFDLYSTFLKFATGPAFEQYSSPRGLSQENVRLVLWETSVQAYTHDFEYFRTSPRSGHQFNVTGKRAAESIGSNLSLTVLSADSTHLWNLASWDPPIFVLGLRTHFSSSNPGSKTAPEDLPASYRYHLGGSDNLRGFGRKALPNTDLGALSSAYVGGELRICNIMSYKLQPFVFGDAALLGDGPVSLDKETIYWSPGAGMRWESPIGSMRTTLGYGMVEGDQKKSLSYLSRWQFYFSFGEQF